jgi:hypothetical protein
MEEEDFRELAQVIRQQLQELGLESVADIDNYVVDAEGERRRPSARVLVFEMLKAFDRHVALLDRSVYEHAMGGIREVISEGARPEDAVIQIDPGVSEIVGARDLFSLRDVHDIGEVRVSLRRLIESLERDEP